MEHCVIRAVLDLGFRLINTITGMPVESRSCLFFRNGEVFTPESRGDGYYCLVNTGREDFDFTVQVIGYEPCELAVKYEELDERTPFLDVPLVPLANKANGPMYITLEGTLSGILSIEAIRLDKPYVNVSSYSEKYGYITLVASTRSYEFEEDRYALLDADGSSYQYIKPTTEREKEKYGFNLAFPLEREFTPNSNMYRIVRGIVRGDQYLLRVQDDGQKLPYLVRYETDDYEKYVLVGMETKPDGKSLIV